MGDAVTSNRWWDWRCDAADRRDQPDRGGSELMP
jgi:hypothetical protein